MLKKCTAGIAAAAAAMMFGGQASAQAASVPAVDSRVLINSAAPVPGGFTAGTWSLANLSPSTPIPAGSTYTIKFSGLVSADSSIGATTVTAPLGLSVKRIASGTYLVTVQQEVRPGYELDGLWSMADTIFTPRATVKISATSLSQGAVDTDPTNDVATYNNSGKGF